MFLHSILFSISFVSFFSFSPSLFSFFLTILFLFCCSLYLSLLLCFSPLCAAHTKGVRSPKGPKKWLFYPCPIIWRSLFQRPLPQQQAIGSNCISLFPIRLHLCVLIYPALFASVLIAEWNELRHCCPFLLFPFFFFFPLNVVCYSSCLRSFSYCFFLFFFVCCPNPHPYYIPFVVPPVSTTKSLIPLILIILSSHLSHPSHPSRPRIPSRIPHSHTLSALPFPNSAELRPFPLCAIKFTHLYLCLLLPCSSLPFRCLYFSWSPYPSFLLTKTALFLVIFAFLSLHLHPPSIPHGIFSYNLLSFGAPFLFHPPPPHPPHTPQIHPFHLLTILLPFLSFSFPPHFATLLSPFT